VLAWLLVGSGDRGDDDGIAVSTGPRPALMFNGRVREWAVAPWVSVGPTMALAWEQAGDSAGPGLAVLVSAVVGVTAVLVGGWVRNPYRAGWATACLARCGIK